MTALLTVIGRSLRIRGRVQGDGDLTIEGHVEGEVAVTGEVTVEADARLGANVSGRVVVVRGAVRGNLTADEAVRLEEGARVVGDLRAPRIAIARGALVRGLVQTGAAIAAGARGTSAAAGTRSSSGASGAASSSGRRPAPVPTSSAAPAQGRTATRVAPTPKPVARVVTNAVTPHAPTALEAPRAPSLPANASNASKGPPPPVVPSLKKGAKAALKKKAT